MSVRGLIEPERPTDAKGIAMAHPATLIGLSGKVSATTVHAEVETAFKEEARARGVSITTVLREALYGFASERLGVNAELPPPTNYNQK